MSQTRQASLSEGNAEQDEEREHPTMSENAARFIDVSNVLPTGPSSWPPIRIPKDAIDAEIERLAAAPSAEDGRRSSLIVHPNSAGAGLGLAPGVDVTINVLR